MNHSIDQGTVVCIHEDRLSHLIGAKLAVLSLMHHCPDLPIVLSCPSPPASLRHWVEGLKNVRLVSYPELRNLGWNVKPAVFLRLFEAGYSEIIWMDSDIIANGDILSKLLLYSAKILVLTQETYWGQEQSGNFRTLAWGFTLGRDLPCALNTGIIRATTHHIQLIKAWQIMLNHPLYVHAQTLPWLERPVHMVGDQDALTALMGGSEFANTPISMLKRGEDIAQCVGPSGFTPIERLRSLSTGLPPLIHAQGAKPWTKPSQPPTILNSQKPLLKSLREYYSYVSLELAPYESVARQYQAGLEEDSTWMDIESNLGKFIVGLAGNHPILRDFSLALFDAVTRRIRRYLKIARYSVSPEFFLKESPLKQISSE